ncbi:hypothetical protein F441_04658 [Phytophthora nicotianae CJ01A1]|uniref:Uncharacterized protein n=3 Tax=Phytophthora nicotianae TaxID=4792 RepID=W2ZUF5_PHYNI|nr:hypothetical protein F444_04704 [Phytophthora nicotianae P1976]ETP21931.1 hypothetical protein F441_04658 [Phytophthora nicotianae CJ01A1]ETP49834.1 hypothetical protein F442_04720 [Phytophthora nicotianae P10297]
MENPASARGFGRLPAKPDPKSFIRKGGYKYPENIFIYHD